MDQLRATMHGRLPAALHAAADRVVANTSVLSVRPLLFASVQLNPRLPLQLNGMTLSQVSGLCVYVCGVRVRVRMYVYTYSSVHAAADRAVAN